MLTCAASQRPPHAYLFERCFLRSPKITASHSQTGARHCGLRSTESSGSTRITGCGEFWLRDSEW